MRRLSAEIHGLFSELDTGRISLDVFRERLRELGIFETIEARRLLGQMPCSFTQLFRALMRVPSEAATASPRASVNAHAGSDLSKPGAADEGSSWVPSGTSFAVG